MNKEFVKFYTEVLKLLVVIDVASIGYVVHETQNLPWGDDASGLVIAAIVIAVITSILSGAITWEIVERIKRIND